MKKTKLTDNQIDIIVLELLNFEGFYNNGLNPALHYKIDRIVNRLNYISINQMDLGRKPNLPIEEYFRVRDKIWELVTDNILAPGRSYEEPTFPYLHLTEKGKEWLKERTE